MNTIPGKIVLQKRRRDNHIPKNQELREFITTETALQIMLKGILQVETKGC